MFVYFYLLSGYLLAGNKTRKWQRICEMLLEEIVAERKSLLHAEVVGSNPGSGLSGWSLPVHAVSVYPVILGRKELERRND